MNQKGFTPILIVLIVLAVLAGGVYYLRKMSTQPLTFQSADKITLQEAKERAIFQ